MKYKFTKAEQETVINFDNELDTASVYTHDSRLIKKLRELRKQYPEQFILEHREHGSVTYTIPKRCVGIRPPYSEKRREQQRQEAKENGLPFMEKGDRFRTLLQEKPFFFMAQQVLFMSSLISCLLLMSFTLESLQTS